MTAIQPYTKRPATPVYDNGWFDVEHGNIQRSMAAIQATGVLAATAPLHFDTATQTLSLTSGAGPTTAMRTSDVSNATGSAVTAGLTFAVGIGESWNARWVLFIGSSAAASGGLVVSIAFPTAGHARSAANQTTLSAASPMSGSALGGVDLSAGDGTLIVDACFRGFTAAGTVDLKFVHAVGGETWIVRDSSALIAQKI